MDITAIVLMVAVGMLLLAILTITVFSIRNVITGRHEWAKVGVMFVPLVIFAATYSLLGSASEAGLGTLVVMMGLLTLLIAYSGLRRSFK